MKGLEHYQKGVNLGGWLSQYELFDEEHFATFIRREDIHKIAAWGFDHVRLPIDYPVWEAGYQYIDACVEWCRQEGLAIVLDLHKAPGFTFENGFDNPLFKEEELKRRFVEIWRDFAKHYQKEGDGVMFELLNEVHVQEVESLNELYGRAIEAIREISPGRKILLGSNQGNRAGELKHLKLYEDENIIYGFHFYDPFFFTHQRAEWTPIQKCLNAVQPYPGKMENVDTFLKIIPQDEEGERRTRNLVFDKEYLEGKLAEVDDFVAASKKSVYCGELGAITLADEKSRANWYQDTISVFRKRDIGFAIWNYKEMSFGVTNADGGVESAVVLEAILQALG